MGSRTTSGTPSAAPRPRPRSASSAVSSRSTTTPSWGFCTFVPRFETSAEVTWMAVAAERRRQGIGHALIDALASELTREGRRILAVLTVSRDDPGEEPDDGYQSTRRFYEHAGFVLVRDLPGSGTAATPRC